MIDVLKGDDLKRIWFFALAFKLILAALIPLSADEAYYWVWSKNLQLSYFDHPGMVAWLFSLGAPFESIGHAVRWPAVIIGHCSLLIWILILKMSDFDSNKIKWWLYIVLFSPLLGFGSLVVTPDLPVLFFWTLSLYYFLKHQQEQKLINSFLLGMALGLGFCSKYHIVLFIPIALAYLTFEKKWPKFKLGAIFVIVISGFLFSLPVLIWNFKNDFASFAFQLNHGLGKSEWNPYWTYTYPIGQIFLVFPLLAWGAIKAKLNQVQRHLLYFAAGPLLFFFLTSFRGIVEMNWPIIGYFSIYALATLGFLSVKPLKVTLAIWLLIYAVVFSHIIFPWIPNAPLKFSELNYYASTLSARHKYDPVFAENYQMSSYLWYVTKKPTYKLNQMSRPDFFDTFQESFPSSSVFYVIMHKDAGLPDWLNKVRHQTAVVENIDEVFCVRRVELL